MAQKLSIEIVDLGEPTGEGLFELNGAKVVMRKFVLLRTDKHVVLVHGPVHTYAYHANLIEGYCNTNDIASHWINKPDVVEIDDASIAIRGGGWIEYDPQKSRLQFGGRSTAYGQYDGELLRIVLADSEVFNSVPTRIR